MRAGLVCPRPCAARRRAAGGTAPGGQGVHHQLEAPRSRGEFGTQGTLRRGCLSHGELNAPKVDFCCHLQYLLNSTHPEIGVGSWHGNSLAFVGYSSVRMNSPPIGRWVKERTNSPTIGQDELSFTRAVSSGEDELVPKLGVSSEGMNSPPNQGLVVMFKLRERSVNGTFGSHLRSTSPAP